MSRSPTETIRFLTLEELARPFATTRTSTRDRALLLLAYRHGLGASEVGLLRTDDIDFRALRIMVHRVKGSHSGVHPMQPDEVKALREYLREQPSPSSPILFPSNRRDPIARRRLDCDRFVADVQDDMRAAVHQLDAGLPRNPHVKITVRRGGWITVSPLQARPDAENIEALKAEVSATWPMTSLLDIIKEADLRLNFTGALSSPTAYETLDRATLRPRLLLCLHGLGTNAGLKRMDASRQGGQTYRELIYARRRYIIPDRLRQAIVIVTNGTLHIRNPAIWGDGTTACASDSKHFGAWDQNLTTQRHVEKKSLWIHSQLKSPLSSEVAAMIEGVIRHCTEMAVDRQFVDSHGQSEVAFAFCRLLGFQLLPRLKNIGRQRLYRLPQGNPTLIRICGTS